MLGGDAWLDEFLESLMESLMDEELENLIKEIQEELRRRKAGRGISIGFHSFLFGTWVHVSYEYTSHK